MECRDGVCRGCTGCSSGERCLRAQCFPANCEDRACVSGTACIEGNCVEADCLGVVCEKGKLCANGTCLPTSCGTQGCLAGKVCSSDSCVNTECVGVACAANQVCAAAQCLDRSCPGQTCAEGAVCVSGVCSDQSCFGVECPSGSVCSAGKCLTQTCAGETCTASQACVGQQCVNIACAGMTCPLENPFCENGACIPCGPASACGTRPEPGATATYSFEGLTVGTLPVSWSAYGPTPSGAISTAGHSGTRAVRVFDSSTTEMTHAVVPIPSNARKVEFWMKSPGVLAEFLLRNGTTPSFVITLQGDNTLTYWNGVASIPIGPTPAGGFGSWAKLGIVVHPGYAVAEVYVNDTWIGVARPMTQVSSFTEFVFAFGGGVPATGEYLIDDVSVSPGPPVDGFETTDQGQVLGWTTDNGVSISSASVFAGSKALQIVASPASSIGAALGFGLGQRSLELWLKLISGGTRFHFFENNITSVLVINVHSDGRISYLGGGNTTGEIAPAGTVPLEVWTKLRIEVSASSPDAAVYVNGAYVGSATLNSQPSSLFKFSITSGDALSSVFIDNVHLE
jgi:hypothetical protein